MIEQVNLFKNEVLEVYIDNHLLGGDMIKFYNMKSTEYNVKMMIKNYVELQYKFINIKPPRLTASYQIRYESYTKKISKPVEYFVDKKITAEEEVENFYYYIKDVLERLTFEELRYYNECLLDRKSEEQLESELNLARKGLSKIKHSCLLKFAFAFGLEELNKI